MRLTAFFKLYKICILLHRCNLKIFAKNRFEKLRILQKKKKKEKKEKEKKNCEFRKISENFRKFWQILLIFEKNVILELCKGVHCVDLDESFQTHIYLQNLASIQPRTSPLKFVGSRGADPSAGPTPAPAWARRGSPECLRASARLFMWKRAPHARQISASYILISVC